MPLTAENILKHETEIPLKPTASLSRGLERPSCTLVQKFSETHCDAWLANSPASCSPVICSPLIGDAMISGKTEVMAFDFQDNINNIPDFDGDNFANQHEPENSSDFLRSPLSAQSENITGRKNEQTLVKIQKRLDKENREKFSMLQQTSKRDIEKKKITDILDKYSLRNKNKISKDTDEGAEDIKQQVSLLSHNGKQSNSPDTCDKGSVHQPDDVKSDSNERIIITEATGNCNSDLNDLVGVDDKESENISSDISGVFKSGRHENVVISTTSCSLKNKIIDQSTETSRKESVHVSSDITTNKSSGSSSIKETKAKEEISGKKLQTSSTGDGVQPKKVKDRKLTLSPQSVVNKMSRNSKEAQQAGAKLTRITNNKPPASVKTGATAELQKGSSPSNQPTARNSRMTQENKNKTETSNTQTGVRKPGVRTQKKPLKAEREQKSVQKTDSSRQDQPLKAEKGQKSVLKTNSSRQDQPLKAEIGQKSVQKTDSSRQDQPLKAEKGQKSVLKTDSSRQDQLLKAERGQKSVQKTDSSRQDQPLKAEKGQKSVLKTDSSRQDQPLKAEIGQKSVQKTDSSRQDQPLKAEKGQKSVLKTDSSHQDQPFKAERGQKSSPRQQLTVTIPSQTNKRGHSSSSSRSSRQTRVVSKPSQKSGDRQHLVRDSKIRSQEQQLERNATDKISVRNPNKPHLISGKSKGSKVEQYNEKKTSAASQEITHPKKEKAGDVEGERQKHFSDQQAIPKKSKDSPQTVGEYTSKQPAAVSSCDSIAEVISVC